MIKKCKFVISSLALSVALGSVAMAAPSLVNGVAFFVNGEPVTLMEVYRLQQREKLSQDAVVDRLINERLHENEIKKRRISVNEIEIDDEIARVAKQNKTTPDAIKKYVEGNKGSWKLYRDDIKKELLKRKLYQSITQESLRMVDDRELREYYHANQREFLLPQSIDVVKFYSKDNVALEKLIQSGGKTILSGVKQENEVLQTMALNPQVALAFVQGKVGGFTPIFPIENDYVTFLIKAKNNPVLLPYDSAKNIAMQKIMQQKENYVIYEYFEKLRSNAKVNIVRLN